ncbi:hypothetical protein R83H12_02033 [Fibrobacteria bacterium R8-3-H12]
MLNYDDYLDYLKQPNDAVEAAIAETTAQKNALQKEIEAQEQQNNELLKEIKILRQQGIIVDFIDLRDGKVYKTVKIGEQVWMAQNLNYECEGSKFYKNNPENGKKYGRLYDWKTAKKACPPGWHLPTDEEWQTLVDFAGGDKVAGKHLKAKSGWADKEEKSGNGIDNYGFSALPGGRGFSDGSFDYVGYEGCWWSASENVIRFMLRNREIANWGSLYKDDLSSVRCVED